MSVVAIPLSLDARVVKSRVDFLAIASRYTRLRRAGRQFVGLCPLHSEHHPSFYVNPERKIFYCFGCGAGGDLFDFVMKAESCDFLDALWIVADFSSAGSPRERAREARERFRAGVGASPGRAKRGNPYSQDTQPRERSFSPANRWPSVEDCAAERAYFTCQKPDNFS